MTSSDIPMNDESTSHTRPQLNSSSSTEPATHNTHSSSSSTSSSLVDPVHQPLDSSPTTSWTGMDANNEENSGAEQVEMRKLNSFEVVHRPIPSRQLPRSPPLTRVPSNDSTSVHIPAPPPLDNGDAAQGLEEVDIANSHWLPERAQSPGKEEHDQDTLYIDPETYEKRRSRTKRRPALLNLEFRKPSPQPWDIVDPPPENNGRLENSYYSPPPHSTTYATQPTPCVVLR